MALVIMSLMDYIVYKMAVLSANVTNVVLLVLGTILMIKMLHNSQVKAVH